MQIDDRDWFSWEGVARIRQACEQKAASEGLAGIWLLMREQELFREALEAKPTYRQRQAEWRGKQEASASEPRGEVDALREALRAIADGHNNPRALAREVLSQ